MNVKATFETHFLLRKITFHLSTLKEPVSTSSDGYFFTGLRILINTAVLCCAVLCTDGFQSLSKALYYPVRLLTFNCYFEITYKF